jgi:hypothetical protein
VDGTICSLIGLRIGGPYTSSIFDSPRFKPFRSWLDHERFKNEKRFVEQIIAIHRALNLGKESFRECHGLFEAERPGFDVVLFANTIHEPANDIVR